MRENQFEVREAKKKISQSCKFHQNTVKIKFNVHSSGVQKFPSLSRRRFCCCYFSYSLNVVLSHTKRRDDDGHRAEREREEA